MKAAVRMFLQSEMKIPEETVTSITINKVFRPASQRADWSTLYAEFDDMATASLIQQFARNLQAGKRLSIYVPASLQLNFMKTNT